MQAVKISEAPGFVKNPANKSVVNVDAEALEAYRRRRNEAQEFRTAISDINTLKQELFEIKMLLHSFIAKQG